MKRTILDHVQMYKHNRILARLTELALAPKICEVVEEPNLVFVNYLNERTSARLIPEMTATGFGIRPGLAHLKAICEWTERLAMRSSSKAIRFDHGSDGCAAFPVSLSRDRALLESRSRALAEAVERFVWAKWWDDEAISHDLFPVEDDHILLGPLKRFVDIEKIVMVRPMHSMSRDINVEIYFAFLSNGGVISGGAAGTREIKTRALSELLRHCLAFSRYRDQGLEPQSLYERRLVYFALDRSLLERRIGVSGSRIVKLPALKFDRELSHLLSPDVIVYQCLFEDQPMFIGGALERLCL